MKKNWYYSADGQEKKGPLPESEMKSLLASGQVPASVLVWSEGMASWAPANTVAALQAAPAASAAVAPVAVAAAAAGGASLPAGLTSWMAFVAVMKMIHGILMCITCIGAIAGVPKIIGALNLLNSKNELLALKTIDPAMLPFLEKQRIAFKSLGWSIIGLFIMVPLVIILEFALFLPLIGRSVRF
jgi:hypothetical protein